MDFHCVVVVDMMQFAVVGAAAAAVVVGDLVVHDAVAAVVDDAVGSPADVADVAAAAVQLDKEQGYQNLTCLIAAEAWIELQDS